MSKRMPKQRAISICLSALRVGMPATAEKFGMTKQNVERVFHCYKSMVMLHSELVNENGKERNFSELRKIFADWNV